VEHAALAAAMDQSPLAVPADPYAHRLHDAAAGGGAVPGRIVQVEAVEALGTVVSVADAAARRGDQMAADAAGKGFDFIGAEGFSALFVSIAGHKAPPGMLHCHIREVLLFSLRKPPGLLHKPTVSS
jgi:hypothetical protein